MRRTRAVALATASLIGIALALPMTTSNAGATPGPSRAAVKDGRSTPSDDLTPPWRTKYDHRTTKAA